MVIGILRMRDERRRDRPAVSKRQPLEGRANRQANHRRWIVRGEPLEPLEQRWRCVAPLDGQLNHPAPDRRIGVVEQPLDMGSRELSGDVHRPDHPQPLGHGRGGGELRFKQPRSLGGEPAGSGPLLQEPTGMTHEPVVVMTEQIDQRCVALAAKVDLRRRRCRPIVDHLEDSPIAPIVLVVLRGMALSAVVPVDEHHLPVRPDLQRDELRPRVVGEEKVGLAIPHVA